MYQKVKTFFIFAALIFSVGSVVQGQNSTKKIRVVPNEISSKIGTAIPWESDFDAAMKKSIESGKQLFWYVPRLADTFMDRKKEVDRYMRAGPFSNATIIASLDEHYIPLMAIPNKEQAKKYNLKPFKFVEPGFLILETDGAVATKLDRITTMNEPWLSSFLKSPTKLTAPSDLLVRARDQFARGKYEEVKALKQTDVAGDDAVELQLLSAMAMFRMNEHATAYERFEQIGKAFPNHPLGWKAAAEAQRIGPFVRGFEVFRELPAAAKSAGRKSPGSAAPANTYTETELWRRGIEFLLTMQNERGGFEESDYDFGGTDGLPNVHVAVTSIAAMALLEAHDRAGMQDLKPRIEIAVQKAAEYVSDKSNLNPKDKDEIFWAYLYRLRLFNRLHAKWATGTTQVEEALNSLKSIQTAGGDWYHEYKNPFVTASALWAMKESESVGVRPDASSVEAGLAALKKCRYSNAAWSYGSRGDVSTKKARAGGVIGSAGRMPLCEGAMFIWEQSESKELLKSLRSAFAKHQDMERARKYDDHTAPYSYGGFFYWYCMQSRTEAILKVADSDARRKFSDKQKAIVMSVPEIDGCFVDSHEIGRSYGTAMALLCLRDCEKANEEGAAQ